MSAVDEVHYEGAYWRDIDWSKPIHSLGPTCDQCGSDGAEGHQNACPYLFKNQQEPRGRTFLRDQIRLAIERELLAGNDILAKLKRRR